MNRTFFCCRLAVALCLLGVSNAQAQTVFDNGAVNTVTTPLADVLVSNATTVDFQAGSAAQAPAMANAITAVSVSGDSVILLNGGTIRGGDDSVGGGEAGAGIGGVDTAVIVNDGNVRGGDNNNVLGTGGVGIRLRPVASACSLEVNGGVIVGGNAQIDFSAGAGIVSDRCNTLVTMGSISGGNGIGGIADGSVGLDAGGPLVSTQISGGTFSGGLNADGTRATAVAIDGPVQVTGGTFIGGSPASGGVSRFPLFFIDESQGEISGGIFQPAVGAVALRISEAPGFTVSGGEFPPGALWSLDEGSIVTVVGSGLTNTLNPGGDGGTVVGRLADGSPIDIVYTVVEMSEVLVRNIDPPPGSAGEARIEPIPLGQAWTMLVLSAGLCGLSLRALRRRWSR
ncbi:MAG: hypothetical protein AAGI11_05045 [Pseudomonadota bacterium]